MNFNKLFFELIEKKQKVCYHEEEEWRKKHYNGILLFMRDCK